LIKDHKCLLSAFWGFFASWPCFWTSYTIKESDMKTIYDYCNVCVQTKQVNKYPHNLLDPSSSIFFGHIVKGQWRFPLKGNLIREYYHVHNIYASLVFFFSSNKCERWQVFKLRFVLLRKIKERRWRSNWKHKELITLITLCCIVP